jgi:hypothetical protein
MNVTFGLAARNRALGSSARMMSRTCAGVRSLHSVMTKMRSGSGGTPAGSTTNAPPISRNGMGAPIAVAQ